MMRFGLVLTPYSPTDRIGMREVLEIAKVAKASGFTSFVNGESYAGHPSYVPAAIPSLARLAGDLGPDVRYVVGVLLLPLHNPVEVAENIAVLDQICYGKLVFGVGMGWRTEDFAAFGCDLQDRVGRFVRNLDVIRALWSGEPVDFESPYCTLHGVRSAVLPLQTHGPPVWMAAYKDSAVRRVAALADSWYISPHTQLSTLRRQLALYRAELKKLGHSEPTELPMRREVVVSNDARRARDEAQRFLMPLYDNVIRRGHGFDLPADDRLEPDFDTLHRDRFIIGDAVEVREQIARYEELLGVSDLIVRIAFPGMDVHEVCARLDHFGEAVIGKC